MAAKTTPARVDKGQGIGGDKQPGMDLARLKAPFPGEKISWRVGATTQDKSKGIALAYIDARDLYARLDDVCGAENWQIIYPQANGKTTCQIGIKINDEWVWKANGAGDTDFEGEKGAYSDAAKRAGVPWGIAAYLYDMPNIWVPIEPAGKSYKIRETEIPRLIQAHDNLVKGVKSGTINPMDKTGNPAVDKTVMEALQHIRNTIDKEGCISVSRYQWKLCQESGATKEQLSLIEQEKDKQYELLTAKGQ